MNTQRMRLLLCMGPALLFLTTVCNADTVTLGIGGHLYGQYSLAANTTVSEGFSLDQAIELTSLEVGISPVYGGFGPLNGSYQVTLSGPGGTYAVTQFSSNETTPEYWVSTPLPDILSAGNYELNFIGGPCGDPCYTFVAGIDYYTPSTFAGHT